MNAGGLKPDHKKPLVATTMWSLADFKPTNQALVLPWDIYSMVFSAAVWGILYTVLNQAVFKPLSHSLFPLTQKSSRKVVLHTRHKFRIAAWKFVHYGMMALLGLSILSQESWALDQKAYFEGWPMHPISSATKVYYNAGFGLYLFGYFRLI
jgi:hypothetical protein